MTHKADGLNRYYRTFNMDVAEYAFFSSANWNIIQDRSPLGP